MASKTTFLKSAFKFIEGLDMLYDIVHNKGE